MGRFVVCPDCRHEVSGSAKVCPRCGRPMGRSLAGFAIKAIVIVPLLFLGSLYLLARMLSDGGRPGTEARAVLELPGGRGVWLATSEADWDSLLDAENAAAAGGPGAGEAINRMAEEGRARKYPNGTPVRVLKTSPLSRFVEVTDGEDRGRSGWVQAEFVRPAGP